MRVDRALIGLHGAGVVIALTAALAWPRPGQAALMVPLAGNDVRSVLHWAAAEDARLLTLDTANGRVIARISDNHSLMSAIGAGILPVAAREPGCQSQQKRAAQ